VHKEF